MISFKFTILANYHWWYDWWDLLGACCCRGRRGWCAKSVACVE